MKKIMLLLSILALAACSSGGGGDSGENIQPLNKDQKKVLRVAGQEITDVSLATSDYTGIQFNIRNLAPVGEFSIHPLGISQKGQQYKAELDQVAANPTKCEVAKNGMPTGQGQIEELDIEVEVSDSQDGTCPFASTMTFVMERDEQVAGQVVTNEMNIVSEADFEVMESASLFLAMDITRYTSKYTAEDRSVQSNTGLIQTAKMNGSGTFYSKSHGNITFSVVGTSNKTYSTSDEVNVTEELTVRFKLKDFTAVGVVRGKQVDADKKIDYTYFVNNEEVRRTEYRRYFGERVGNIPTDIQD